DIRPFPTRRSSDLIGVCQVSGRDAFPIEDPEVDGREDVGRDPAGTALLAALIEPATRFRLKRAVILSRCAAAGSLAQISIFRTSIPLRLKSSWTAIRLLPSLGKIRHWAVGDIPNPRRHFALRNQQVEALMICA